MQKKRNKYVLIFVEVMLCCVFFIPIFASAKVYSPSPESKSIDFNNTRESPNTIKPGYKAPLLTPEQLKRREEETVVQTENNLTSNSIPPWLLLLSSASIAALGAAWMIAKNKTASVADKFYSTSVGQFILGTANALVSNFVFGIGRQEATTKVFRWGQVLGDGLSMVASAVEIAVALTTDVLVGGGGLVLAPVTGGGSLVVSAGAVMTGAAVTAHASGQAVSAIYQMSKAYGDFNNLRPKTKITPEDFADRHTHILEGEPEIDSGGNPTGNYTGGHEYGASEGKQFANRHSEFPQNWSSDKILQSIADVVNDGTSTIKHFKGSIYNFINTVDGVKINVGVKIVNGIHKVLTGFPLY